MDESPGVQAPAGASGVDPAGRRPSVIKRLVKRLRCWRLRHVWTSSNRKPGQVTCMRCGARRSA